MYATILLAAGLAAVQTERPNVVVVLADDLGYGDLGCYGNDIVRTPHLDQLAKDGLKLTSCYAAAPNCSPARTGLMTGRTPFRVGIHNWIPSLSPMHVRESEITVATLLRNAGYATCHSGKWHLNGKFNHSDQPQPSDHGFDHWFSTQNNALPNHCNPDNFVRNGKEVGKLEGYSADLVVEEAVQWLESGRDPEKPFFLYVCFHEPHEPIASAEKYRKLYPSDDPSYGAFHGNVTQMDAAFGRLRQKLQDLGLEESTLLFFTSDNGPAITSRHPHGSSGPLRDKKGSLYEGGIRVPGILHWPGRTRPGSVSDEPVSGVDLLPTLCEIVKIPAPDDRTIDGASILPILDGDKIERRLPLYWQFNRARTGPKVVMRDGDWKIAAYLDADDLTPSGSITEEDATILKAAKLDRFELYRLSDDIGESKELSGRKPETFARLRAKLERLYNDVREESPVWPAWEWPRYEQQRIEWTPQSRGRRKG